MGIDAFGRSTDPQSARTAATRPSGGDGGGKIPGWVVALVLAVISLGGTAVYLVQEERQNRDDPVQQALRGEIQNLDSRSLLRTGELRAAMRAAAGRLADDEVVTGMTIAPTRVQVTVRDRGAFQRLLAVDVALGTTATDAGRSESDGLAASRVDLAGVEPAVRRVLGRIEEKTARIDTVTLSLTSSDGVARQSEWRIQVNDVRPRDATWYASADGSAIRRNDEDATITRPELRPVATPEPAATPVRPSSSTTTTTTSSITIVRNGKRVKLSGAKARRLQRCLGKAAGDRPAFTACLQQAGL